MTHPDESATVTLPTPSLPTPTLVNPAATEADRWRRRFDRERTARREAEALLETAMNDLLLARQRLDEQHAFIDALLDQADTHFYVKDEDGRLVYVNQKSADMFGWDKRDIIGRRQSDLLPPDVAADFMRTDAEVFRDGKTVKTRQKVHQDGVERTYWTIKAPFDTVDGRRHLVGFSTDVSELEALRRELADLALRDSVTGVLNHRAFREEAQRICNEMHETDTTISLLVIDVDHFKRVNDLHGHLAGDDVLHAMAQHMQRHARDTDVFARVGGEEFAFLLPDTGNEEATALAARLVASIRELEICVADGQVSNPTISVGVTTCLLGEHGIDAAFRRADRALYRAKEQGRNRWQSEP